MKEGPGAVSGWTTNKRDGMNIDVFQQRLIFIPGEFVRVCKKNGFLVTRQQPICGKC